MCLWWANIITIGGDNWFQKMNFTFPLIYVIGFFLIFPLEREHSGSSGDENLDFSPLILKISTLDTEYILKTSCDINFLIHTMTFRM